MRAAGAPSPSPVDAAAATAVARFVRTGDVVGVGPGALAAPLLAALATRTDGVRILAAGDAPSAEAALAGVPQAPADSPVSIAFITADELDGDATPSGFAYITCRGDGVETAAQPQLDRVASVSARAARGVVALLPHPERLVTRLGGDVPVLVDLDSFDNVADEIDDIFIGDAEVWRRPARPDEASAGPRGGPSPHVDPVASATLLDIRFGDAPLVKDGEEVPYTDILDAVVGVPGVGAVGLGFAVAAIVAGGAAGGAPAVLET